MPQKKLKTTGWAVIGKNVLVYEKLRNDFLSKDFEYSTIAMFDNRQDAIEYLRGRKLHGLKRYHKIIKVEIKEI